MERVEAENTVGLTQASPWPGATVRGLVLVATGEWATKGFYLLTRLPGMFIEWLW